MSHVNSGVSSAPAQGVLLLVPILCLCPGGRRQSRAGRFAACMRVAVCFVAATLGHIVQRCCGGGGGDGGVDVASFAGLLGAWDATLW